MFWPGRADSHVDDDFLRLCRFKWSFNIKPDLVIQNSGSGRAIVMEAKYGSPVSRYPSSAQERAIFAARDVGFVSQLDIQRFLFEQVLDVTYVPLVIKRKVGKVPSDPNTAELTWDDAFAGLDLTAMSPFANTFINSRFGGSAV